MGDIVPSRMLSLKSLSRLVSTATQDTYSGEVTFPSAAVVLRHMCKYKDSCSRFIKDREA
jgi:hypothetical protein